MKKGTGFLTLFGGAVAVCALLAAPVSMRAQETETIEDGVYIGNIFGNRYKKSAELAGGIILVLIGLKILIEHLRA